MYALYFMPQQPDKDNFFSKVAKEEIRDNSDFYKSAKQHWPTQLLNYYVAAFYVFLRV